MLRERRITTTYLAGAIDLATHTRLSLPTRMALFLYADTGESVTAVLTQKPRHSQLPNLPFQIFHSRIEHRDSPSSDWEGLHFAAVAPGVCALCCGNPWPLQLLHSHYPFRHYLILIDNGLFQAAMGIFVPVTIESTVSFIGYCG